MQDPVLGGVGRGLVNLLPRLEGHVDLELLTDSRQAALDSRVSQHQLLTPVPGVSASWLQLSAAWWLRGFDGVFHCPYYALPAYLPVPGVATIYDITFEHFPDWFSRRQGLSFRLQARRAAHTAAVVITGSEFVRQDLISTYQIDPARILVAPQGVDPVFSPDADSEPVLRRLGVAGRYVVALGGATRRNLPLAIEAWRPLKREVSLIVVGGQVPQPEERLFWAGPVDDASFAGLLAHADAFLYPTAYEGFGMPGLEAMGAGVPVVAVRNGALPEVLGDAAMWSDSLEAPELTKTLENLLADEELAADLTKRGLLRASSQPGWDFAGEVHLEAYRLAGASGRQRSSRNWRGTHVD